MEIFNKKTKGLFLIKIIILFILLIGGVFICNRITDQYFSNRHFGSYNDKIETLKKTKGNRTIFVGGSSVLMGVNAEYYSKISGESAINMGLHALKIYDIYLACIEPYIKSGDKIILAFEYYPYNYKWENYDDTGLYVAHESELYYKLVPIKYRAIYTYQQFLSSYSKVYNFLYTRILASQFKEKEKAYLRENINEYGDMKININANSENPSPYHYSLTFNLDAAKSIMNYIEKYEKLGAKVYIVYPPIYTDQPIQDNYQQLEEFHNKMCSYFGERVLGNPTDWMFNEGSNFWDTGYHLISSAALNHTQYYYDLIKSAE